MRQMNPEEARSNWQDTYGTYRGTSQNEDHFPGSQGEKLHTKDDDLYEDQFATFIARKIRLEIRNELQQAKGPSASQRLALAIVSLSLPVLLLIILVANISDIARAGAGASIAMVWASIAVCIVIVVVNVIFNRPH